MDETRRALAALYRMRGRETLREAEFVLEASMTLRWYTPKEAQRLLQRGVDLGLLRSDGGSVAPTFDVRSVDVPYNYRPGPEAIAAPKAEDLFHRLLSRIQSSQGEGRSAVVARINRVQDRLGVDGDVAAALVARGLGIDVSDLLPELQQEVLRRAR